VTTEPGLASQAEKVPLFLAVMAVAVVVIPAGLLGGAFAAPVAGLPDVGLLVRWGLPMVRAIHDLAAATTIGLLVVAARIIPEACHTSRRITDGQAGPVRAVGDLLNGNHELTLPALGEPVDPSGLMPRFRRPRYR
jgi:hypothetical protein